MAYELHGVWACADNERKCWVGLKEVDKGIFLEAIYNPTLTAEQARYLARKLNHMARRLEQGRDTNG